MQNEVMLRNKTKRLPSHFLGFLCSSFGSTRKQLCLRDPWLRWHRFGSRHAHRSGSYQEKEWKASSPPGIFSYSFPFFFLSPSQTLAERTPLQNTKVCNLRKLPWRKESNLDAGKVLFQMLIGFDCLSSFVENLQLLDYTRPSLSSRPQDQNILEFIEVELRETVLWFLAFT